jgi:hypothetical protein
LTLPDVGATLPSVKKNPDMIKDPGLIETFLARIGVAASVESADESKAVHRKGLLSRLRARRRVDPTN